MIYLFVVKPSKKYVYRLWSVSQWSQMQAKKMPTGQLELLLLSITIGNNGYLMRNGLVLKLVYTTLCEQDVPLRQLRRGAKNHIYGKQRKQ